MHDEMTVWGSPRGEILVLPSRIGSTIRISLRQRPAPLRGPGVVAGSGIVSVPALVELDEAPDRRTLPSGRCEALGVRPQTGQPVDQQRLCLGILVLFQQRRAEQAPRVPEQPRVRRRACPRDVAHVAELGVTRALEVARVDRLTQDDFGFGRLAQADEQSDDGLELLGTFEGDVCWAWGISDAGHVVGTYRDLPGPRQSFLYFKGQMQALPTPLFFENSKAQDVNADGVIVGWAYDGNNNGHVWEPGHRAYLWQDGQAFRLDDLVDVPFGTNLLQAHTILDDGTIAGRAMVDGMFRGFVLEPVVPGDVNGDGAVTVEDLVAVISAWGTCPGCPADLNHDGIVDVADLVIVLLEWS